jgi:serine protease Do
MQLHQPLLQGRSVTLRRALRRWTFAAILSAGALAPALAGSPPIPNPNPRITPAVEVARKVRGAVVNIHSERTISNPADPFHPTMPSVNRVNGMGTGIVIDPRGYIVTNNHVVDEVQVIRIHLSDGSSHNARVMARDSENDLAILKIDAGKPLPTLPLGTASDLMVLEPVIAIGNAYGYEHTHTMGTVSAVKRDVALNREMSYKGLIQTDASINPGNSGGPLLNLYGELIGVNVAIRAGAQNIGFAIPVDSMIQVAAELISVRHRTGVSHGLTMRDQVDTASNPVIRTSIVERVQSGSAAERAGLRPGDQVLRVAGVEVGCTLDLERGFLEKRGGEKVAVSVRRGSEDRTMELVVPTGAGTVMASSSPVGSTDTSWRRIGLRVAAVDASAVTATNPQLRGGAIVQDLDPDGPAAQAGIQRGDILIGLHQFETLNPDNVAWILNHPDLASFSPLKFFVIRAGQLREGYLPQINN